MFSSQSIVSSSRTVLPCNSWGGQWIGHWKTTWSMVWSSAPHSQAAESAIPICANRNGNVRRRCGGCWAEHMLFLAGPFQEGGSGIKVRNLVMLSDLSTFHQWSAHSAALLLLSSDKLMCCCAVGKNGCMSVGRIFYGALGDFSKLFLRGKQKWWNCFFPLEIKKTTFFGGIFKIQGWPKTLSPLQRPWMGVSIWDAVHSHSMDRWALSGADVQPPWHGMLRDSVALLLRSSAGWMPARIGRLSAGVGRRQPGTACKVSLMARSMRRVWALPHQTEAQYSAVKWTRAKVAVRNVTSPAASQPEPASRIKGATREVSFF